MKMKNFEKYEKNMIGKNLTKEHGLIKKLKKHRYGVV